MLNAKQLLVANDFDFASKGKPLESRIRSKICYSYLFALYILIISGLVFFANQINLPVHSFQCNYHLLLINRAHNGIKLDGSSPFRIVLKEMDYCLKLVDYSSNSEKIGDLCKGGQPLELEFP